MALRIFEPRYVRMVTQACQQNSGFVMCMMNAKGDTKRNQHICSIGTYASIVDFDRLPGDLLGITVAGHLCVNIHDITTQHDGLKMGTCLETAPLRGEIDDELLVPLRDKLNQIFDRYDEIQRLYQSPRFDEPIWVVYRWLELLPIDVTTKQQLLHEGDLNAVVDYLSQLVC